MKEEFIKYAKKWGVDLVGFLNLADYNSPRSPDPKRYLKNAKSIIVLAFRPVAGAYSYEENTWSKMPSYLYTVESAANTACYHLGKYLEDKYGCGVFIVQAHRPFELNEITYRAPIGSISLRHSAVQCGMAVWGKNTLALTPEFGPRVMFMGLLTTFDIPTDKPKKELKKYTPCQLCNFDCTSACPGNAFAENGKVISHRCVKTSQPDDVGNFMRYAIEIINEHNVEKRMSMINSSRFFRHLQYLQFFIHYHCDVCLRQCPTLKEIVSIRKSKH